MLSHAVSKCNIVLHTEVGTGCHPQTCSPLGLLTVPESHGHIYTQLQGHTLPPSLSSLAASRKPLGTVRTPGQRQALGEGA